METPRPDWSLAFDEDLTGRDVSSVFPPFPSPWTVQPSIWSSTSPFASGLKEATPPDTGLFEHTHIMPVRAETKETQTEDWTEEKTSNTNDDWHLHMRSVDEHCTVLVQQYEALMKQQATDQAGHQALTEALEKTRDEKKRQHQSLLDKIESLSVKLDLNSSKTTRKNFVVKLEELTAEKERLVEGQKRLAQELEEVDTKLKTLLEDQSNEKISWQKDIDELQAEKERITRQVEAANQAALKDEMAALDSQREVAVSLVEDWIAEAERYLGTLRLDPSPQHSRQRLDWEKNVVVVRNSLTGLQNKYDENLKLLQKGQRLDSLPPVPVPSLPNVPTIELFMGPLINSIQLPYFDGAMLRAPPPSSVTQPPFHTTHRFAAPPPIAVSQSMAPPPIAVSQSMAPPPPPSSAYAPEQSSHIPKPQLTMPTAFPPRLPAHTHVVVPLSCPLPQDSGMPSLLLPHMHPSNYAVVPPTHGSAATAHVAPPSATSQVGVAPSQTVAVGQSRGAGPGAQTPRPTSTNAPSNPPPAAKLDHFLERLGMRFPECTRSQLMGVLQQIKSERGTVAGLSTDDIIQQVAQRLAQGERPAPGPIGPRSGSRDFPGPPGLVQRPSGQPLPPVHPHVRAPGAQVFPSRPSQQWAPSLPKLCLMCQNHVEAGSQYITNCDHTLHKECISVWLKSSKSNSCPFCPSK